MRKCLVAGFLIVLAASGCHKSEKQSQEASPPQALSTPGGDLRAKARALFGVLPDLAAPKKYAMSDAKVALGRVLYYDPRLSRGQDLSCSSCHALDGFGADTRAQAIEHGTSFGFQGKFGERNAPSVFNAALHISQFWDGRASDVEEQAKGPVLNPVEMAMESEDAVVHVLKSIPGYAPLFAAAFPDEKDPITYENMARAIGAFERKLLTPAPFDKFLADDDAALTDVQQKGLSIFIDHGCVACHGGPGIGGGMYQKLGLLKPFKTQDEGRFKRTGNPADKFYFKVPGLRNVVKTAPYFHDGSIKTLPEAIRIMSAYQTPLGPLSDEQVDQVAAFLGALTGTGPAVLLTPPELPKSGPKTPRPMLD